jgi:hypothetical protein
MTAGGSGGRRLGGRARLGERFCGPPGSANGGYACGAIAELLGGGVEVTLRRPPPRGRLLWLQVDDGDELVAEARPATVALAVPGTASSWNIWCSLQQWLSWSG